MVPGLARSRAARMIRFSSIAAATTTVRTDPSHRRSARFTKPELVRTVEAPHGEVPATTNVADVG